MAEPVFEQGFSYSLLPGCTEVSSYKWWHAFDQKGGGVYTDSVARIDGNSTNPDPSFLLYFPDYIKPVQIRYITVNNNSYAYSPLGCTVYASGDKINFTELGSITHAAANNTERTVPCSTNKYWRYLKVVWAHGSAYEVGIFEFYIDGTCLKYPPMYENAWAAKTPSQYYIKY